MRASKFLEPVTLVPGSSFRDDFETVKKSLDLLTSVCAASSIGLERIDRYPQRSEWASLAERLGAEYQEPVPSPDVGYS